MKFFNIIVILFLHCFRLPCEMKSHHSLMSWNFIPGLKSQYKQPLKQSFLWNWLIIFIKGSILYVWLGSECTCCVLNNSLFAKFLIPPYLSLFLVFNGDSNLRLFQLFWFSMKHIHLHYNWQQNRFKKFGDIFQSIPT